MPEITAASASRDVKTRFLVFSDTHGLDSDSLPDSIKCQYADVVIHCGDLTAQSEIDDYIASIRFLQALNAPLKLVIAGNHDFTMDIPVFQRKMAEAQPPLDPRLVEKTFGKFGEARQLFNETDITFLDEGIHSFRLQNGALLNVYASPYTPSLGGWGFQYHPNQGHEYSFHNVEVVITHGPPKGVMDSTRSGERVGSQCLFEAIAQAQPRPRLHCFGHIHEAWGAKLVTWRENVSPQPSHLTDIDNEKSVLIESLSTIREKADARSLECSATSHCSDDPIPLKPGSQTLFVNAAIQGSYPLPIQPPWLVDIELPAAP